MSAQHPDDKVGILEITGGVTSEEAVLAFKVGLEDLPGVHGVEFVPEDLRIHFNPDLATILLTAALSVLSVGCAHREQATRPMIYRGGQSYDRAIHADDVSAR